MDGIYVSCEMLEFADGDGAPQDRKIKHIFMLDMSQADGTAVTCDTHPLSEGMASMCRVTIRSACKYTVKLQKRFVPRAYASLDHGEHQYFTSELT